MGVSRDDVKRVAALARLRVTDDQASRLTAELNTILGHMEVLAKVEVGKVEPVVGVGAESVPLAPDRGPSVLLSRPIDEIAPEMRDGFFLVPRLPTHESPDEA